MDEQRAGPSAPRGEPAGGPSLDALLRAMPFAVSLGMELTAATRDEVRGWMPWRESLCTVAGVLHGGALMAFADSLGGTCAFLNLEHGESTSTIESKTNFFRGVRRGRLRGVSIPLHVGRSTVVVQTDLLDDEDRLVARVTQTQARLAPHS